MNTFAAELGRISLTRFSWFTEIPGSVVVSTAGCFNELKSKAWPNPFGNGGKLISES